MSLNYTFLGMLFLPLIFLFGLYFEVLGLKLLAFSGLFFAIYLVLMVPYRWALFSTFIYIGLEGFFKVISNYHPFVHVGSDIVVIALCFKVLLQIFFKGADFSKTPPLTKVFVVHFCWIAIILFNPYSLSIVASIAGSKIYVTMFLLYFFGYYLTDSESDVRFYMWPFIIVAVLHTITGVIQGFTGPEGLIAMHPRYAVQLAKYQGLAFRPFGLTNQPGAPSVYIYLVYPFLLYFAFTMRSLVAKILIIGFLPFSTFLFFLCQVRSALLKMIVSSSLFLIGSISIYTKSSSRAAQGLIFSLASILLVIYFALPQFMSASVESRDENEAAIERSMSLFEYDKVSHARRGAWKRFLMYAQEVPLGAGFSRVGAAAGAFKELHKVDKTFGYKHFFADNLWLTALIEIGLPGMFLLGFLVLSILWIGFKNYRDCKIESLKMLHLVILSTLIALIIGLYGAEGLIYNPEACFFWFFSGVLMKLPELQGQKGQRI
jgi:O-antigen ligase